MSAGRHLNRSPPPKTGIETRPSMPLDSVAEPTNNMITRPPFDSSAYRP